LKAETLPAGVVLAGGRSRRMQGQTKALVDLGGKPLMQHVIDRLEPQVSSLSLSVDSENPELERFGLPQLPDPRQGSRGPLGGLLAALEALPQGIDYLLLTPCDAPFLPLDLAQRLMQHLLLSGQAACIVRYEDELQPTFSLWHRRLLPDVRGAVLDQGLAGFKQFLGWAYLSVLDWATEEVSPFFNVNTPEDLAQAHLVLESGLIARECAPT
jgi:molybdopterin-guanine dinucleotide biosynthesis protein A